MATIYLQGIYLIMRILIELLESGSPDSWAASAVVSAFKRDVDGWEQDAKKALGE